MVFLCGQYYIGYLCLYFPTYRRKVENKAFSLPSDTSFLSFPAIVFHFLFFPFSLTESSKSVLNARFSQIFQISSLPPRKLLLSLYQHFFSPSREINGSDFPPAPTFMLRDFPVLRVCKDLFPQTTKQIRPTGVQIKSGKR